MNEYLVIEMSNHGNVVQHWSYTLEHAMWIKSNIESRDRTATVMIYKLTKVVDPETTTPDTLE